MRFYYSVVWLGIITPFTNDQVLRSPILKTNVFALKTGYNLHMHRCQ